MRICVYCASSEACDAVYHTAARDVGRELAAGGCTIVYGGGATGLMGSLADGALAAGGSVVGIIPRFMTEVEWQHPGLAELDIVDDMRERKRRMLDGADAVIALPGGCGTLEELFEAMTLKRLGLYFGPIVLLDTAAFYAPLQAFLERMIALRFMNPEHRGLWTLVARPDQVLPAIRATPAWPRNARAFAATHAPAADRVNRSG